MSEVFVQETEIDERGLRRLAQSRECSLIKTGNEYQVLGAGIVGIPLTDDECWDVLSAMPQIYTLGGRNRPVV